MKNYINAILQEIDEGKQSIDEKSVLGGWIRWTPVTGKFIPITEYKKKKATLSTINKKQWWLKYGKRAREYARQNHLPGPNLQDVAPSITPELVEYIHWTEDDPDEVKIRRLIVEQIVSILLAEGRIKKHPERNLYRRMW